MFGKQIRLFNGPAPEESRTVVGVASNIVQKFLTQSDSWRGGIEPLIYVPYGQKPAAAMTVFVRSRVPSDSLIPAVRREVQALDPDLGIGVRSLADNLALTHTESTTNTILLLVFAAIGLVLASLGLYSVMAHTVTLRTREMGIRMALGASARTVLMLVLKQGSLLVGLGLTIGLAGSFAITPILRSVLTQVSPADPAAFVVASAALVLAATLGCLVAAGRAARVDPVVALRQE